MGNMDSCEYHARVAARLRSLLAISRTPAALKTQLLRKAEKHERLAKGIKIGGASPLKCGAAD
jgi:hypothetical protein